jgi:hypothetical protein
MGLKLGLSWDKNKNGVVYKHAKKEKIPTQQKGNNTELEMII